MCVCVRVCVVSSLLFTNLTAAEFIYHTVLLMNCIAQCWLEQEGNVERDKRETTRVSGEGKV